MGYNRLMTEDQGLIYIFTGDGKGKTSAALGTAMRALAAGLRVAIIQWYKDPSWRISEHAIDTLLTPEAKQRFQFHPMGVGFHIPRAKIAPLSNGQVVVDKASEPQHRQAAAAALTKATELLPQVDILILDEINNAIHDNLLPVDDVINVIQKRAKTHLVLTGRNAHPEIIKLADLITDMTKVKHPYDQGKLAVKGLDF